MKRNVIDFLERGALRAFPDRPAIVEESRSITFAELGSRSKRCATLLAQRAQKINQPIAVYLPKCTEAILADIGITYSGNIFCNLDVKSPAQRIRNILDKVEPALVITSRGMVDALTGVGVSRDGIACIEDLFDGGVVDEHLLRDRLDKVIDTDPAYIINTSGSTGTPKGVALSHRGTIDFMEWLFDTFDFDERERIGSLSPHYFDIYILELFLCLSTGAALLLVPDKAAAFPARLLEFLQGQDVNFLFWVPSIMVTIANLDLLGKYDLSALRNIFFAGEVFPTKQLNQWRRALPRTRFVNLYGPIEIHIDCTCFIVDREFADNEPLPIGHPCRNSDILILNDRDEACAAGEHGELCVRGSSLALGYWNDPEMTAKAFVQNPLNMRYPELIYRTGDIAYRGERDEIFLVGRKDFQIKHLGYRIDLQEIEHQIGCVDGVGQVCALYNRPLKEITVFYEALHQDVTPAGIRTHLAAIFPKYMIPVVYRKLEAIPRNPNGKIDRNKLAGLLGEPK